MTSSARVFHAAALEKIGCHKLDKKKLRLLEMKVYFWSAAKTFRVYLSVRPLSFHSPSKQRFGTMSSRAPFSFFLFCFFGFSDVMKSS